MKRLLEAWTAETLYRKRSLIQYPEFQREPTVWNDERKRKLIDSMLRGFDIPKIYLFKSGTSEQYDCIDGRQRIESILEFFDGYLQLDDKRDWDRLSLQEQETLNNYEFTISLIVQATEEELRLLFLRLQLGAPLNVGEKLRAIQGEMRDFVFEVGKCHPFFKKVRIPSRRFAKETVFAQICINSFYRSLHDTFYGARYEELSAFFSQFQKLDNYQPQIENITSTLNKLDQALGDNVYKLRNRAVIVSGYLFFEELLASRSIEEISAFPRFYLMFIDTLTYQSKQGLEYDRKYRQILDFQTYIIQAAASKSSIQRRHEMLWEYFEHFIQTGEIKTNSV